VLSLRAFHHSTNIALESTLSMILKWTKISRVVSRLISSSLKRSGRLRSALSWRTVAEAFWREARSGNGFFAARALSNPHELAGAVLMVLPQQDEQSFAGFLTELTLRVVRPPGVFRIGGLNPCCRVRPPIGNEGAGFHIFAKSLERRQLVGDCEIRNALL
jgi:hypothetical protein